MGNTSQALKVVHLKVHFFVKGKTIRAVNDVSFSLKKHTTLGIVGESGCGKSTIGFAILRLLPVKKSRIESGSIYFEGMDLCRVSETQMHHIRGNLISMVFQDPMTALNPVFTVGFQIKEVIKLHHKVSGNELRDQSLRALSTVGIPSPQKFAQLYPHQLSGGMRQRVLIAIALACDPQILIADEPTTALDVTIQAQILELISTIQSNSGMSVIFISHDLGIIAENADDVAVIYCGKLMEFADATTIYAKPMHPYTVALLEAIPKINSKNVRLATIPGTIPDAGESYPGCCFYPRCREKMEICKSKRPPIQMKDLNHGVACWKYA